MHLKSRDFYHRYSDGYTRKCSDSCPANLSSVSTAVRNADALILSIESQYSESNVMHFLFSLRIKDLYMFRALLAHPQDSLHKWHFVYCVMSLGCTRIGAAK
jgi:hypothetical protein